MRQRHTCRFLWHNLKLNLLTNSGIDAEFEKLLANIFGRDFVETYKLRRPSGWTDLMVAFESRKRSASPNKSHPLNVCLPFSFIEQHKKLRVRASVGIG